MGQNVDRVDIAIGAHSTLHPLAHTHSNCCSCNCQACSQCSPKDIHRLGSALEREAICNDALRSKCFLNFSAITLNRKYCFLFILTFRYHFEFTRQAGSGFCGASLTLQPSVHRGWTVTSSKACLSALSTASGARLPWAPPAPLTIDWLG